MGENTTAARANTFTRLLDDVHAELATLDDGELAGYIPELARVEPDRFSIALTTPDGHRHLVGDVDTAFTIQSVSKAFVYGIVLDELGVEATEARVDLEPSGDAFNEISLDPVTSKPRNAMINAGAIAVTGLVPGGDVADRFEWLRDRLGAFAGRTLELDHAVYESERATGHRNRAIGHLLLSGGVAGPAIEEDLDLYFRQCSLLVTSADLSVMGATLANGGINPVTGARVIGEAAVERVLSVMASSGMYDWSGSWITEVGLPAKSGVGGGIVAVLPGQLSLAVHSPRLDAQGNSVRGIEAFRRLSRRFNLHVFNTPTLANEAVRRTYRLDRSGSSRRRPLADRRLLDELGVAVAVVEVQGDLFFAAVERLSRTIDHQDGASVFVIDAARVGLVDPLVPDLLDEVASDLATDGRRLVLVDPARRFDRDRDSPVTIADSLDDALEREEQLLLGRDDDTGRVGLDECDLFVGIHHDDLMTLRAELTEQTVEAGAVLCRVGDPGDSLFVLLDGSLDVSVDGHRISSVAPGACVGEIALIAGGLRSADVVAARRSSHVQVTRESWERIETERPVLASRLMRNMLTMNLEQLRRRTATG